MDINGPLHGALRSGTSIDTASKDATNPGWPNHDALLVW
jgi:hypothetical protein